METREVLPAEFDTLEQELEKALPFSICVRLSNMLHVIEKQWWLISCSILDYLTIVDVIIIIKNVENWKLKTSVLKCK